MTILSYHKGYTFGKIDENIMYLNSYGGIVQRCWRDLEKYYNNIKLDAFVIMPNHVHGVIIIEDIHPARSVVRAGLKPAPTVNNPPPEIIRGFKTFSARRINEFRHTSDVPIWQRNYYEHILRNDDELYATRKYIEDNVVNWKLDIVNPDFK